MRYFCLIALIFTCFPVFANSITGFIQAPAGPIQKLTLSGWACEKTNDSPIEVHLFVGDTLDSATLVSTIKANRSSEDTIRQICQTSQDHRFKFDIPQSIVFAYSGQKVFVTAGDINLEKTLNSTQQYSLPEHPETSLIGYLDGITEINNAHFAMGWACQTSVSQAVSLNFYTVDSDDIRIPIETPKSQGVISERAVLKLCNANDAKHRFRVRLPEDIIDAYPNRPLYVEVKAALGTQKRTLQKYRAVNIPSKVASDTTVARPPNVVLFFTDDQGYADLSVQNVLDDISTPNIDLLAQQGVRFTSGYITAPQCSPSRAAMITGKHQSTFKMDENQHIPMTLDVETLASKFKRQGYKTAMLGKWHLEIMNSSVEWGAENYPDIVPFRSNQVPREERLQYFPHERGFDDMLAGYSGSYLRNIDDQGNSIPVESHVNTDFRVDLVSDASLNFIDKNWTKPFYMHIAHYAPHVPLEAPQRYLDMFPGDMPERRRYALAMMAAVDEGVGRVVDKLKNYNLLDNTIILFISDNGAPLGDDMTDAPIAKRSEAWNGSRNDPFTGEKGMLTEGALRVPFIAQWPAQIPAGLVIDTPVSALDAAYTMLKSSGSDELDELEGIDLMPLIGGDDAEFMERPMHWRFYFQRAIRQGNWKYMQAGIAREYLFDMTQTEPESVNYIEQYPEIANELRDKYWLWANQMPRPEPLIEIPKPFANRVDLYLPVSTP